MIKRQAATLLVVVLLLSAAGCGNFATPPNPVAGGKILKATAGPVYPKGVDFDDYEGRRAVRDENPVADEVKEGTHFFAGVTSAGILGKPGENRVYSPMSLYMALALASSGAEGQTKQELTALLGLRGWETDALSREMGNLFRRLYTDNKVGRLGLANSLWLSKEFTFHEAFLGRASGDFYASLYTVPFGTADADATMSRWVYDNTGGLLFPKVETDPEALLSILSTIHYQDQWVDQFVKSSNIVEAFYLREGGEVLPEYMCRTYESHSYLAGDGFLAAGISLKNGGSMTFVLPNEGGTPEELLADPSTLTAILRGDDQMWGRVVFQIPKFDFGSRMELTDMLKELGLETAFGMSADFSGITDGPAFIGSVSQEACVAIDEDGVTAAAFTRIDYAGAAPPDGNLAELILNRPFAFLITSSEGFPLFVGVVADPTRG